MPDINLTAAENYANAAPAPAFNVETVPDDKWRDIRGNQLRYNLEQLLKAEAEGNTILVTHYADRVAGWLMQLRACAGRAA